MFSRIHSLRKRLWMVILAATLPLALVLSFEYVQSRANAESGLRALIARNDTLIQKEEKRALDDVKQVLQVMSRANDMFDKHGQGCNGLATRMLRTFDTLSNLGAAWPSGEVFCSGQPVDRSTPKVMVNDRAWFQEGLRSFGLTQGVYVLGRISKQAGITFGLPMRNPDGSVYAVTFAALQSKWFDQLVQSFRLETGWDAVIVSESGDPLSSESTLQNGATVANIKNNWHQLKGLSAGKSPTAELVGDDNISRLYGVFRLNISSTPIYAVITAPLGVTEARISGAFRNNLMILFAVTVLAALIARLEVHKLIEQWTFRAQRALLAISKGQLGTRIDPVSEVHELGALDLNINRMAEALGKADEGLRTLRTAIEQSPQCIVITDVEANIQFVNRAFEMVSGYPSDELIGRNPRVLNKGKTTPQTYEAMWSTLLQGEVWRGEFTNTRKDGTTYNEFATIAPVKDQAGLTTHYVAIKEDLTEKKLMEEKAYRLAYFDQLTGLPNRYLLGDRLQQVQLSGERSRRYGLLMFLDIDRFKHINDTLGHAVGDDVLKQSARRLRDSVRDQDTVARLGDDSFAVVVTDLSVQELEAATEAEAIAIKLHAALNQPFLIGTEQTQYLATTSIGMVLFRGRQAPMEALRKQAEMALDRAKEEGRNTIRFFSESMQALVEKKVELEQGLRNALERDEFQMYLQAQADRTGRIVGAEALVRWQKDGQLVLPADFIPLAEETGLIVPIGHWMLRKACQQLAQWAGQPASADLTLSINISSRQFRQPNFVSDVLQCVTEFGIRPHRLILEVTESVMLHDLDTCVQKMHALQESGVQLSLDDFGTGYSSLSYLKNLPFNELKIDQSFVRDMLQDNGSAAIVQSILAISNALGLKVVAEGVETQEVMKALIGFNCDVYQGYAIGHPTPSGVWDKR